MNDFSAAKSMWGFRKHPLKKNNKNLKYIWFTMLYQFLVYRKMIQILFHYSLLQDRV